MKSPGSPAPRAADAADADIRDMRHMLWCSIDDDDSRDIDQITVAAELPSGAVTVYVGIADVDALVLPGTAIDRHAQANTTSVYTPARIFSMLPEKLSTNLTSLSENEDRLAIVIEMVVGADGITQSANIYRALVRNQAQLAYNSVAAGLESDDIGAMTDKVTAVTGLDAQLRLQDRVAQRLKQVRHLHGALEFETIEPRAVIDNDRIVDLVREPKKSRCVG
jgi:exoribonuclease R